MSREKSTAAESPAAPTTIEVRGACVHNLANVDVDIPLNRMVAIAGVSGSGKSSLAMGVLYAEGSRRYIEALSTYTRRRMSHATKATVDSVRHVPAALALRQRPGVPGARSTFGTSTELLNVLRLLFSRLAEHVCPNGHRQQPTIDVAAGLDLTCPVCGVTFSPPGAEALAFNSDGACATCGGLGVVREIDDALLVPDPSRTIADGAVAPWKMMGLTVMPQMVGELGVRTDVPYRDLTDDERDIVLHGPAEKHRITVPSKSGKLFEINFVYRNARLAVQEALDKAASEAGVNRVNKFINTGTCPTCHGARLSERALAPHVAGINLAEATAKPLDEVIAWAPTILDTLPPDMRSMATAIVGQLLEMAERLVELGLGYLGLDRPSATLSTGERQRVALSRAVRNQTTGVLYVLDEPSIGLHPSNIDGLNGVIRDLLRDGNSVVLVDRSACAKRSPQDSFSTTAGSAWPPVRCTRCTLSTSKFPKADSPRSPESPGPARPRWCWRAWCRRCRPRRPASACPHTSPRWNRRASNASMLSMPPPSAPTCGPPSPPTVASSTSFAVPTPPSTSRRAVASPHPTSHTTPDRCAAHAARAQARSRSTSSFSPTSTSPAPNATAPAMPLPHRIFGAAGRTGCRCPHS
ncbi:hypothetical protein [Antrihabitans spumae]|uniref:UvrABC system protein A n=1 Tax=Antrihabitans spumae TaxID=3373370 RepID=A0ABW7KSY5_9NOCA